MLISGIGEIVQSRVVGGREGTGRDIGNYFIAGIARVCSGLGGTKTVQQAIVGGGIDDSSAVLD